MYYTWVILIPSLSSMPRSLLTCKTSSPASFSEIEKSCTFSYIGEKHAVISPHSSSLFSWLAFKSKENLTCSVSYSLIVRYMSRRMTKPTKWPVRPAKAQISLGICPVWSVFAVRVKKHWALNYLLSAQQTLIRLGVCPGWSESSLGAHHFIGFVVKQLTCKCPPTTRSLRL